MKRLLIGEEATKAAVSALTKIANGIGSTLGPAGCPAIIDKYEPSLKVTRPISTKDGVTVLEHFQFDDAIEHAIHGLAVAASQHTVRLAGDGTTSTIVLADKIAQAILSDNNKTPQAYAREVSSLIDDVIANISKFKISSKNNAYTAALTASNGDKEIANITKTIIEKVSKYSNVTVVKEPTRPEKYTLDVTDGYTCGGGYRKFRQLSITINKLANDSMTEWSISKPLVVIINGNLTSMELVDKIMDKITEREDLTSTHSNFLLLAFSVDDDIASKISQINRTTDTKIMVSEVAVATGIEGHGFQVFADAAAYCGCEIYDPVSEFDCDLHVGSCEEVLFASYKTIIKGKSPKNTIIQRCKENNDLLKFAGNQYQRDIISTRNSELANGTLTVTVGGGQSASVQERADRLDDAIRAAQSAVNDGVVAGSGLTYIRAAKIAGIDIKCPSLYNALHGVYNTVMDNFGIKATPVDDNILAEKKKTFIINNGVWGYDDAVKNGVVDSILAVKTVLMQATQLAILVTTTRCLSVDDKQKERNSLSMMQNYLQ